MKEGLVSVIMSNYNTPEEFLRESIESVLNQTYSNFEFIIVDDCSTDNSPEIIESYSDSRIIFLRNEANFGITRSLNVALQKARGEYIARMDADDICCPERFEKQVEYLKTHKDTVVCGTYVKLFGSGADKLKHKETKKVIPKKKFFQILLLFGNHTNIIHPTAMFRHSVLIDNSVKYNENYIFAQDYRMWVELSRLGECANVPEVLFRYRMHDKAVSSDKKRIQSDCARRIMEEQLSWLGLKLPSRWREIHYGFFTGRKQYDIETYKWIKILISANNENGVFNKSAFADMLWKKWAETTYFEFRKVKGLKKIKVLNKLPARYYTELLRIMLERRKG